MEAQTNGHTNGVVRRGRKAKEVSVDDPNITEIDLKLSKAKKQKDEPIEIPELRIGTLELLLEGESPLIVHKFSTKSKTQMADKQQGRAAHRKDPKDPIQCWQDSLYVIPGKKGDSYGFPASGFKKAAVSACRHVEGISMAMAKGSFHVLGDLIEILGPKPKPIIGQGMREDVVRIGGMSKTADLRYRAEFREWSVKIKVRYNQASIT